MAEHASVIRIARFLPAAGKRDQVVARIQGGVEQMRRADGCFGVQVCSVREAPEVVTVVSRWASQSALDRFWSSGTLDSATLGDLAPQPTLEHMVPID